MLEIALGENCRFAYSRDWELLFAAQNILTGEPVHKLCSQIFGGEALEAWRRQYPFLFEVCGELAKLSPFWCWEPLLRYVPRSFTLDAYEAFLLELPREDLIHDALSLDFHPEMGRERVTAALTEDDAAAALLTAVDPKGQLRFLPFLAFLRQTGRLLHDLFALARALNTPALAAALDEAAPRVQAELDTAREGLENQDPLEYSQQRMGKTFGNRGPYSGFYFFPSLFLPGRACRFFRPSPWAKDQILFLSLRVPSGNPKTTVQQLKALADETRFRILTLLAQGKARRGLDIAKTLHLAPSTVSHHMDQLRQAGLVHEELLKDGKYYSLSRNGIQDLLELLHKTFQK